MITENIKTGRSVKVKKQTVETTIKLDILDIKRNLDFNEGPDWTWTAEWKNNNSVYFSLNYKLNRHSSQPHSINIKYQLKYYKIDQMYNLNYNILLESTPCHLGGRRWWFICPIKQDGKTCTSKSRILYLPNNSQYFACRKCHNLTYTSRQQHRNKFYETTLKPYRRLLKIEKKLKGSLSYKERYNLSYEYRKLTDNMSRIEPNKYF